MIRITLISPELRIPTSSGTVDFIITASSLRSMLSMFAYVPITSYFYNFALKQSNFLLLFFFFQAEDGIRDIGVTGVQTCALPISRRRSGPQTRSGQWFEASGAATPKANQSRHCIGDRKAAIGRSQWDRLTRRIRRGKGGGRAKPTAGQAPPPNKK